MMLNFVSTDHERPERAWACIKGLEQMNKFNPSTLTKLVCSNSYLSGIHWMPYQCWMLAQVLSHPVTHLVFTSRCQCLSFINLTNEETESQRGLAKVTDIQLTCVHTYVQAGRHGFW